MKRTLHTLATLLMVGLWAWVAFLADQALRVA
jgi:hypothetical protein